MGASSSGLLDLARREAIRPRRPVASSIIACPDCGAVQEMAPITRGHLRCWRCRCVLERAAGRPRGAALACALATLLLLVPGNLLLLMSLSRDGFAGQTFLSSGIAVMWQQGWVPTAIAVALLAIVLPFLRFGLLAAALAWVLLRRPVHWTGWAFRYAEQLDLWAMPDVFLIGCAIGYSRLAPFANVRIGPGGWCFIGAALMAMTTRATLERRRVWRDIGAEVASGSADAFGCIACERLVPAGYEGQRCPRCGARLSRGKPNAMRAALALTIAGLLLYPVANLYPISVLDWFAGRSAHTLSSAVSKLIGANLWFLAACVFTTSIAIPFVKLVGMLWFCLSVYRRSTRHLVFKTRFYRFIDELGRWSTMDVFTVVVYMPLVQFGQLASVKVGIGLPALLAVVLLTMFASRAFDPRMLWDAVEPQ